MSAWLVITADLSTLGWVWEIGDAAASQGDSDDAGAGSIEVYRGFDPGRFEADVGGRSAGLAEQVLRILRESYADLGPTLAAEKLAARHHIDLCKETVRRLQMAAGLWIPRKLRPPKIQQPRARRACIGELVQIDACEHRWFEDRAPMCTAIVYVDDPTSRLMVVRFTGAESTFAYFDATREYLEHYGKPLAFYSD